MRLSLFLPLPIGQFIGKRLRRYRSSVEQGIYDFKKSFGLHKIIFCSFVVQYVLQPFGKSADMQSVNEGVVRLNGKRQP